eukprot:4469004-Amphidinium_carterae.1
MAPKGKQRRGPNFGLPRLRRAAVLTFETRQEAPRCAALFRSLSFGQVLAVAKDGGRAMGTVCWYRCQLSGLLTMVCIVPWLRPPILVCWPTRSSCGICLEDYGKSLFQRIRWHGFESAAASQEAGWQSASSQTSLAHITYHN